METFSFLPAWQGHLKLVVLSVSPKIEFGGSNQARTKNGTPKWQVEVHSPVLGGSFKVGVASDNAPNVTQYEPAVFEGLIVGGSSKGLWWHAQGVLSAPAAPEPKP